MRPPPRFSLWFAVFGAASVLVSSSCTRSRDREFQAVVRSVDAHQLQSWAVEALKRYSNGTRLSVYFPGMMERTGVLVLSNAPSCVLDIPHFGRIGPEIMVSRSIERTKRCVSLFYFEGVWGGDSHCILAGAEDFTQPTNAACVQWIPGVYYVMGHSP